jgi:serpin B
MKILLNILLAVAILTLSACAGGTPVAQTPDPAPTDAPGATPSPVVAPNEIQLVRSERSRNLDPRINPEDLAELVEGNSRFAFDLLQQLKKEDENLFFSPISISIALAMTYAGARGDTEEQIAETMYFTLPHSTLHATFNYVDLALEKLNEDPETFRLNIVNTLFGQQGYQFRPEYLDLLALFYGAGMNLMDFVADPEGSRLIINEWVSDQTEGRIEDLIPEDAIDEYTRLVLVNAIYFIARWSYPFEESLTSEAPFYLLDGTQINTPTMHQTESYNYARGSNYQLIELPYDGWKSSMVILVPDEGDFNIFQNRLSYELLQSGLANMSRVNMDLSMPKFSYDSSFSLKDALQELGMTDAFVNAVANFSRMDGTRDLLIKDVVHQAFVAVDEKGTEAAAATGVIVGIESAMIDTITVTIDRPFFFLIRDLETGSILFLGRVLDPSS